jgi:hypothetical protein
MNSEKILQKIRMIMKENFFYKKDILLKAIRTPKEYPYIQIFAALTQLIEDKNEFITDKYGRNGRLVNIGEYYLFQPIELTDQNVSIFDRSVPIDYKNNYIEFEFKEDSTKEKNKIIDNIPDNKDNDKGKLLLDEMSLNLNISKEYTNQPKVPRGDDNWYKHCGIVMRKMSKEYPECKEFLIDYLVAHMIELLLYNDKLELMNYIYSLNKITQGTIEWYIKDYFEKNSILTESFNAFIMYNLNKRIIVILNENNKWVEAEPEDEREIAMSKDAKKFLNIPIDNFNKIIGFIGYEKNNKYLTFKTKDIDSTRDTGARCDESGKEKTIKKLEMFLDKSAFDSLVLRPKLNKDNEIVVDKDDNPVEEMIGHSEMCVLLELVLRYLNSSNLKKDNKKYFLTPELAIYYKLYKVSENK